MNTPLTDNPTTKFAANGHAPSTPSRPDPQVPERASRRRFTAAYKLRILKEADACSQSGELGALLRREGLYSSTLANFRKLRDAGKLGEKNPAQAQQRKDKEAARQRDARRLVALEAENQKLRVLLELQKKSSGLARPDTGSNAARISLIAEAGATTGIGRACDAVGLSRTRFYREQRAQGSAPRQCVPIPNVRQGHPRRLSEEERAELLNLLLSERFVDASPRQVYAQLLQEGEYHASYRTMYRLLHQHQAVCERRKLRRHPVYSKPELQASGPNQVWTWDITYLKTPVRGCFYYLYVVIDIYSR